VIFIVSPVRVLTDSRYAALIGPALWRHGSVALDPWFPNRGDLPYQVQAAGAHVYPWFPVGGPLLATPFVWLLARMGLSAVGADGAYSERGDMIVQAVLAATAMALLAVIVFKTALAVLPPRWSGVIALASVLGTQIWSNSSRVLWGDTFLVLILGVAIWRLVLHEKGTRPLSAPLLATVLAWGYFARPTASIAIVAITLYLLLHHRRLVLPFVATGAAWLALFVVVSRLTFGTWLPSYYRTTTFGVRRFGGALLALWVSPSRGQLIFVPVTAFVAYLVVRYRRSLPLSRLIMPALVAIAGQVALVAAFDAWNGGHCYGPRLLTPLVPWLALLGVLGLSAAREQRAARLRIELCVGAALVACSVLVQARGAWARETWNWNVTPSDVTLHPERVWSWRDAQPVAGLFRARLPQTVPLFPVGGKVDFGSVSAEPYLLSGWSGGEGAFRWTDGRAAELAFGLDAVEPLLLEMQVEAFLPPRRVREQPVKIDVNGTALETVRLNQPGTTTIAVRLPAAALKRENQLRLELPKSAFAAPFGLGSDSRQLGIAVHWLRLRREE
jgi:hypothetical protein